MLCLLFSKRKVRKVQYRNTKIQKKRASTLRYNNLSFLEGFKRFLTGSSCGLPLEIKHLDDLWFATTQL